jgi:hypothetical protein
MAYVSHFLGIRQSASPRLRSTRPGNWGASPVFKIVFPSKRQAEEAMQQLRALGYGTWPDGRALEDGATWAQR